MKYPIAFAAAFTLTLLSFGQSKETADTSWNIMAVEEITDSSYDAYYLLKDERKIGRDSVFMLDAQVDCESEGKILFADKKNNKVGFFGKDGKVVIPAVYNYASPFHNGFSIALRNAVKIPDGEHWFWQGGETVLINEKNEVLADISNIDVSTVDWYSARSRNDAADTGIYINIKGKNDIVYSFIDLKKEFTRWFNNKFLPSLSNKDHRQLESNCFTEVTYWSEENGWTSVNRNAFVLAYAPAISRERFRPKKLKELTISQGSLNPFIFEHEMYKVFYNRCGEHNKERFPVFEVMLTYYKPRKQTLPDTLNASAFNKAYEVDVQDHFEFIKTKDGYKLLSVSLK